MATSIVPNDEKPTDRQFQQQTRHLPTRLLFGRMTKRNAEFPGWRLPFTADNKSGPGLNFWAMPETESYSSGCDLGHYAAIAYLRALRSAPDHCHGVADLVAAVARTNGATLSDSQQGTIVAFFGELQRWLWLSIRMCGNGLETAYTDAELEFRMSEAASRTPEQAREKVRADALAAGVELQP